MAVGVDGLGGSRLLGYVRVSRVSGREGESFISPDVQRERIESYAKAHGHVVGEFITDLDQSGGKLDRPGFQRALEACEEGRAGGIIVARLDRFARSLSDAVASIRRLEAAGAQLVSVADNLDTTSPVGRFARTMMLAIAELERERIAESWQDARDRAIGRGVHIGGQVPTGYVSGVDGRLVSDPVAAGVVRAAFAARAGGASIAEVARILDALGGRTWSNPSTRYLLQNRVYLGEVRHGEAYVNTAAHEPLVSRVAFAAANSIKPSKATRSDSKSDGALLTGIVRCAGCGYALTPSNPKGKRAIYRCKGRHSTGRCPASAVITAGPIDAYLTGLVHGRLVVDAENLESVDVDALDAAIRAAETELDAYLDAMHATDPGFKRGYQTRAAALAFANASVANAATLAVQPDDPFALTIDWQTTSVAEKRAAIASKVTAVFVKKGTASVQDRVHVVWAGQPTPELPRRGRRGTGHATKIPI